MRRLLLLFGAVVTVVIAIFAVAAIAGVPWLTDPTRYLELGAPASSALACGLLVADFALPVPSSLLHAYLGAAHGALVGTLLGAAAHLVGGAIGFGIGRLSAGAVGRWIGDEEHGRVDAMLGRWGILGIAATRPVPVLAEAVAIVAGTTRSIGWGRFVVAATAGGVPYAAINAAAGAEAREGSYGLAVGAAIVIAVALWIFPIARRKFR